jgi:hypothetical protein
VRELFRPIPDLCAAAAPNFQSPHLVCMSADPAGRNSWLLQRQDIRSARYDCNPFFSFEITA